MMKTSYRLKTTVHQLRLPANHVSNSITAHTRLFSQIAPARQAPNSFTPKLTNITPLIEKRRNRAEAFLIPKGICRLLSTNKTIPGLSFSSSDESSLAKAHSIAQAPTIPLEDHEAPKLEYDLTFTCKPCGHRSSHRVSKHGYHVGTVLITCPGCKNRHVISDHLRIFFDVTMTIEDLLRDKGELVKRGNIMENGDIEFWDDASETMKRPSNRSLEKQLTHNLVKEEIRNTSFSELEKLRKFVKKYGIHPTKEMREKVDTSESSVEGDAKL